jgi:hypothetical protein
VLKANLVRLLTQPYRNGWKMGGGGGGGGGGRNNLSLWEDLHR